MSSTRRPRSPPFSLTCSRQISWARRAVLPFDARAPESDRQYPILSGEVSMSVSLDSGSDEVDQSADDRNVLDHVDDLIRAGNRIADESCVDRDRRKDEEHDQRNRNIASPHIE